MDDSPIRAILDPAEIARSLSEALGAGSIQPAAEAQPPADISSLQAAPSPPVPEPPPAAPPVEQPPPIVPEELPPSSPRFSVQSALPWTVSLCTNLVGIVVLALFALPMLVEEQAVLELAAIFSETTEQAEQVQTLEVTAWEHSPDSMSEQVEQVTTILEQEIKVEANQSVDDAAEVTDLLVDPAGDISLVPSKETLSTPISVGITAAPPTEKELNEAGSVEEAVDGVGTQISEMLGEGDLLVVWLLDASLSLVDDRQRVAARLETVYAKIAQEQQTVASRTGAKPPILTNAVVAFGGGAAEVVTPTGRAGRAVSAIRDIPVDPSGLENVFSAVALCARRYGGSVKRQVLVVIWTDESGDDILLLEPTIALCKQEKIRVTTIGPTAVLGAEAGTHSWTHPQNGRLYYLPVKKGPDAAFPERLRWPYWWNASLPAWHTDLETRARFEGWYGGYHLASIASGFPPYALTRLARETGGSMTIFDRGIDRGPFRLSVMRPYAPEYRSAAEIYSDLRYFPLRQAVMASADVTRSFNDHERPQWSYIYKPAGAIRRRLANSASQIKDAAEVAERAAMPFGPDGMEHLYAQEQSPRWRAWYDLTRGRLIAMSVRYAEYRALVELICRPGGIHDEANCLQITPAPRLLLGSITEERAREAERLLTRCLEENPNTPWAYLAQRELDNPLGVTYRAWYQEPPPPVPFVPQAPSAPVVLPKL